MHNVAPTRALTRRSQQVLTLALVVAAVGIFLTVLGILLQVVEFVVPTNAGYGLYNAIRTLILAVGVILLVGVVIMVIRAYTWKTDNDLAQITGSFLSRQLDDRFTLIRNVSKRQIGYVDAVLVGPPGVLVFRILNEAGVFANEGPNWLKQDVRSGEWKPSPVQPTKECVADIEKINQFLTARAINVPVYGVVVFTQDPPTTQLKAREPVVPITPLSMLVVNLQNNYLAADRIDPNTVNTVVGALYTV
jgi:hypothetical protein